jgi:quinoprotein glucose dehydrogenase
VKKNICGSVLALWLFGGLMPLPAQHRADPNFQQSRAKPEPKDLLFVDQGQFDPRLKGYVTPEGFKLEIVADAPTVINPVGMTFGPDGTLFVLEWIPPKDGVSNLSEAQVEFIYKDGSKRKVTIVRKPTKDWVKLLSDTKGKGVYDQARVILHEELPSSILVHDDWIYLSGQGTVRRYPLAQVLKGSQDGKRDFTPQVVAQGFCGIGHHQVSGLTIGNEGWLYITAGDGDNFVEGSDNSRATVLRTGGIFRCRPDGSKIHAFALGFCNPYRDVAFDKAFNMFHADNGNAGSAQFAGCRLMHVPEGADFGWRLRVGAPCCVPDKVRAAVHGELPGKVAPMLKMGRGAAAGLLIYNDTYLPEKYRGWLLYPDAFRQLIRAYKVEPKGATFEVTQQFALLKSADPLFRPCQMVLGPDGAMYICDRRTGGGGWLGGDGEHGRIYRMTWAGTSAEPAIRTRGMDSWANILKQSDADLLKTLESENFSDRQKAQRELVRRGDKQRKPLLTLLADPDRPAPARVAALGALQAFWNGEVKDAFIAQLKHDQPALRRLCADGLALNCARGDKDAHAAIEQHLNEDNPAVLRALYVAIGKVGAPGAANAIVNALQFDENKDAYLRDGMARGLEDVGKEGFQQLLALANSGELKELERVVEIYPTFRTRPAGASLGTLIKSYHLTPAQRVALIRSYNNYQLDPPLPLQPLSDYLAQLDSNPPKGSTPADLVPVKLAGLEVLATNAALNTDKARALLLSLLREQDAAVRISVIKLAEDARVTPAIPLLVDMLGKSDTKAETLALVRALGALPSLGKSQDDATWSTVERVLKAKDAEPALRLEALRTLGAIDVGRSKKHAEALLADPDLQVQREAVVQLGGDAEGARLAGRRLIENKLPRALLPLIADGLRRFARADAECAWLLGEVMKGADQPMPK